MKMILKRALGSTVLSLLMPCLLLCLQAGCKPNPPTAANPGTPTQTAGELQRLQGTWEGVEVGSKSDGKITLTITGNSLHYQGATTSEVYEATFTLPAGTNPQQLRATLIGLPPEANRMSQMEIGEVVPAVLKIEDGTLSLADEPSDGSKPFKDIKRFHYKLRKVQPQKTNAEASTSQ